MTKHAVRVLEVDNGPPSGQAVIPNFGQRVTELDHDSWLECRNVNAVAIPFDSMLLSDV